MPFRSPWVSNLGSPPNEAVEVKSRAPGEVALPIDAASERSRIAETLLASAAQLIKSRNEFEIIEGVCKSLCNVSEHLCLAWTWFGPGDVNVIKPQIYAGEASDYAANLVIERNLLTQLGPAFRTLSGHLTKSKKISKRSLFSPWRDVAYQHGVRSVLAVPLKSDFTGLSGIFVLYADHEDYFSQVGEGLFVAMGSLFTSVLTNAAERSVLEDEVHHDPLTGALTRRAMPIIERRLVRKSAINQMSFVMVVDLDHFKKINDGHGHSKGDEVLKETVQVLGKALRDGDDLMRWGGEEFLIFLHSSSLQDALLVAEKLRSAVEMQVSCIPVTVSIGMAPIDQSFPILHSIEMADKALYLAKSTGRNRVCMA
jgi:diguanylate cyclase (GGDEF)-like protein